MKQAVWSCKIGGADRGALPAGADLPMREAIREAYMKITGREPDFIFSGWGAKLNPAQSEVALEMMLERRQ